MHIVIIFIIANGNYMHIRVSENIGRIKHWQITKVFPLKFKYPHFICKLFTKNDLNLPMFVLYGNTYI